MAAADDCLRFRTRRCAPVLFRAAADAVREPRPAPAAGSRDPTAAPYGIVEITPERGYLLVTELFIGAVEIGTADIDDDIID